MEINYIVCRQSDADCGIVQQHRHGTHCYNSPTDGDDTTPAEIHNPGTVSVKLGALDSDGDFVEKKKDKHFFAAELEGQALQFTFSGLCSGRERLRSSD